MSFEPRKLVKDGRSVAAVGIGGGYGIGARALDAAFEAGINYFFWGPTFPTYYRMTRWLKSRFKTERDKIILGVCPYFWRFPGALSRIINRYLRRLQTDYIDYFHLGMIRTVDDRAYEQLLKFREKGMIRHIAISCHNRKLAAKLVGRWPELDLAQIRYNAAHRGAETEFFPAVDPAKINVVAFNATRHGSLLKRPRGWDKPVPSAGDCYRFALSHPKVSFCLAGPGNESQVKEILSALQKGPMSPEEMNWMREFGDRVYKS